MKLEHCYKCRKQIEFRDRKNPNRLDEVKSEMNRLESKPDSQKSASVFTFWYCNECWFKMGLYLQSHGYLPKGMDGFSQEEDY